MEWGNEKGDKGWKIREKGKRHLDSKSNKNQKQRGGKADDISNTFPNFVALTQEERLAFFEALTAARKNVEKSGLSTGGRFGTVHDEYLKYFVEGESQEDGGDTSESEDEDNGEEGGRRLQFTKQFLEDLVEESLLDSAVTVTGSDQLIHHAVVSLSSHEDLRREAKTGKTQTANTVIPKKVSSSERGLESWAESECESFLQKNRDRIIDMYLKKKKRKSGVKQLLEVLEDDGGQSKGKKTEYMLMLQKTPKWRNKENIEPEKKEPSAINQAPFSKSVPRFNALSPEERKIFFSILKEAHDNILEKNPGKKDEIFPLEVILKGYQSKAEFNYQLTTKIKQSAAAKSRMDHFGRNPTKSEQSGTDQSGTEQSKSDQSRMNMNQSKMGKSKMDQTRGAGSTMDQQGPWTKSSKEQVRWTTSSKDQPISIRTRHERPKSTPWKLEQPKAEPSSKSKSKPGKRNIRLKLTFTSKDNERRDRKMFQMGYSSEADSIATLEKVKDMIARGQIFELKEVEEGESDKDQGSEKNSPTSDKADSYDYGFDNQRTGGGIKEEDEESVSQDQSEIFKWSLEGSPEKEKDKKPTSIQQVKDDILNDTSDSDDSMQSENKVNANQEDEKVKGDLTPKKDDKDEDEKKDERKCHIEGEGEDAKAVDCEDNIPKNDTEEDNFPKTDTGEDNCPKTDTGEDNVPCADEMDDKEKVQDEIHDADEVKDVLERELSESQDIRRKKVEVVEKKREKSNLERVLSEEKENRETQNLPNEEDLFWGDAKCKNWKNKKIEQGRTQEPKLTEDKLDFKAQESKMASQVKIPVILDGESKRVEKIEGVLMLIEERGEFQKAVSKQQEKTPRWEHVRVDTRNASMNYPPPKPEVTEDKRGKDQKKEGKKKKIAHKNVSFKMKEKIDKEGNVALGQKSQPPIAEEKKEEKTKEKADEKKEEKTKEKTGEKKEETTEEEEEEEIEEGDEEEDEEDEGNEEEENTTKKASSVEISFHSRNLLKEKYSRVKGIGGADGRAQRKRSRSRITFVEERPKEVGREPEGVPEFRTGKVVLVDDGVIEKIRTLIQDLEKKAKGEKRGLENEYLELLFGYIDYLSRVLESLIIKTEEARGPATAVGVHLKFEEKKKKEDAEQSARRSFTENVFDSDQDFKNDTQPGTSKVSHVRKPRKSDARNPSNTPDDLKKLKSGESDSSLISISDTESAASDSSSMAKYMYPIATKKKTLPNTKIRLLQDLLKERAEFVEGSINDFKVVRRKEEAYVPVERAKFIVHLGDERQEMSTRTNKFLLGLMRFCRCGKKDEGDEDEILENLKGEAVAVDVSEKQTKTATSATLNEATMEVLKAAERKKVIQKHWKNA